MGYKSLRKRTKKKRTKKILVQAVRMCGPDVEDFLIFNKGLSCSSTKIIMYIVMNLSNY